MNTRIAQIAVFVAASSLTSIAAFGAPLEGTTGSISGQGWQSSWLDLTAPSSFRKGERLSIKVEGDAENVLVRLLPAKSETAAPDGIEGKSRKVPADRVIQVNLERDHPNVKQISVHSGRSAWTTPLGANNGGATVVSVDRSGQ